MVELIRKYGFLLLVPVGLIVTVLALLFVLGLGAEDEVAIFYQVF